MKFSLRKAVMQVSHDVSPLFVRSVEKAFLILASFESAGRRQTLSQLASRAGVDISTAQRYAYTLEKIGFLHKDTIARTYQLSAQVLTLAQCYTANNDFIARSIPAMQHINNITKAGVSLSVMEKGKVVCIAALPPQTILGRMICQGEVLSLFNSASGLSILSHLSTEEIRSIRSEYNSEGDDELRVDVEQRGNIFVSKGSLSEVVMAAAVLGVGSKPVGSLALSFSSGSHGFEDEKGGFETLLEGTAAALSC